MALKRPLVHATGQIEQLQSSDTTPTFGAGSVDNAIVRADGTSNDKIQGSTAAISDLGSLSLTQDVSLEASGSHGQVFAVTDSAGLISFAVYAHTRTSGNIGIADRCLDNVTSGTFNCGIGLAAGDDITTGSHNMLMGTSAGGNIADGDSNICIGSNSGRDNVSGDNNISIGRSAGVSVTSGNGNTFIGANAGNNGSQAASVGNSMALGQDAFTTASNQIVFGNTSITASVIRGQVDCGRGITVNDAGGDFDSRIEGDTLTHMFFCDASAATENIALVAAAAPNWQSMDRGLFIGDTTTAPTGDPSSGVFTYSNSGVLTVRQPDGAVIPVGPVGSPAATIVAVGTATTTNATPANLTFDLPSAYFDLPADSLWSVVVAVVGIDSASKFVMTLNGRINRIGAAAATAMALQTGVDITDGRTADIVASGNALRIQVTGLAATTVKWVARVEVTKVAL